MDVADQGVTEFDRSFGQEAREWLATVCAVMEKTPAGKLFSLLQPSITVLASCSLPGLIMCGLLSAQPTEPLFQIAGPACQSGKSIH